MLAAHLLVIEPFEPGDPATWVDVVNGRSSILFATLAGVSIGLVTGGRSPLYGPPRARASARLALRGAVLWMLGLALIATGVPVYVILPAYGILFLLAIPFLGLGPRVLFAFAAVFALTTPWIQGALDGWAGWTTPGGEQLAAVLGWHYPFVVWISFVLAGLGLGRCDLGSVRVAATALGAGAALAAVGYGLAALFPAPGKGLHAALGGDLDRTLVWTADAHSSGALEVVGSGGFALAVIGLCLLVCRTAVRWVVLPLRAVGAMPLTAYTAQLVVWAVVAAVALGDSGDLVGFRELQPFWPMTLGIVIGCCAWTAFLGRGPLETVVDRLGRWIVPLEAETARSSPAS